MREYVGWGDINVGSGVQEVEMDDQQSPISICVGLLPSEQPTWLRFFFSFVFFGSNWLLELLLPCTVNLRRISHEILRKLSNSLQLSTVNPRGRNGSSNTTSFISITDHVGVDITPSFQVMLYSGTLPSNVSGKGLHDRQMGRVTYVNECLPHDAFKESKCTPQHREPGSLQSWTKSCYKFVTHYDNQGIPSGSSLIQYQRSGHCRIDEICVNTFSAPIAGKQGPQIAMCVAKSSFEPPLDRSKSGLKRLLDAVLETIRGPPTPSKLSKVDSSDVSGGSGNGKSSSSASIAVSQVDGETPIEADTLELAAWNGNEGEISGAGGPQSHKCRDCTDLEVAKLPSDTEHLKLEASMLTAGAMAGILWIAVMSG